jgi:formylglycine-generating enzyme required for sulfatase activity
VLPYDRTYRGSLQQHPSGVRYWASAVSTSVAVRCVREGVGSARAIRGGATKLLNPVATSAGYRDGQRADVGESHLMFRCARRV